MDETWLGLWTEPGILLGGAGTLGLLVGSFLNVLVARLPGMLEHQWRTECRAFLSLPAVEEDAPPGLVRPGSRCPGCQTPLGALENIPLLSFLVQRGRCRHCGTSIALRYPLLESATALLSVVVAGHYGATWATIFALAFTWTLLGLACIDLERQILPDTLTQPLMWAGLLVNQTGGFTDPATSLYGAMAGYLSLWLVAHAFHLATGKEGMGQGDFKLLAALGAWLGWPGLPLVLLLSSLCGAVFGIARVALGHATRDTPLPFGPFLALSGWIALLWGDVFLRFFPG